MKLRRRSVLGECDAQERRARARSRRLRRNREHRSAPLRRRGDSRLRSARGSKTLSESYCGEAGEGGRRSQLDQPPVPEVMLGGTAVDREHDPQQAGDAGGRKADFWRRADRSQLRRAGAGCSRATRRSPRRARSSPARSPAGRRGRSRRTSASRPRRVRPGRAGAASGGRCARRTPEPSRASSKACRSSVRSRVVGNIANLPAAVQGSLSSVPESIPELPR